MVTKEQIRGARAMLDLNVRELAAKAKVSPNTVTSAEKGTANHASVVAIKVILESEGIEFLDEDAIRLKR